MKTARKSIRAWIGLSILIVALATGVYHFSASRAAEQMLSRSQPHLQNLTAQEKQLHSDLEELRIRPETPPARTNVLPRITTNVPARARKAFNLGIFLRDRSDLRDLYIGSARTAHWETYAALVHRLQLSEAETEEFLNEMVRHELRSHELSAQRLEARTSNDDEAATLWVNERHRHATALEALLGGEGYECFQHYHQLRPLRANVMEVVQRLYSTSDPLSHDRAENLTAILARHATNSAGRIVPSALDWDAALAEASSILSPAQFAALRIQSEQAQLNTRISAMERSFRQKNAGPSN